MKKVRRGEIYLADLDPVKGSEQGGIRPVLITQNDTGNRYSPTTVVIPFTTKLHKYNDLPTHVIMEGIAGMTEKSMSMAEQIRTIDKVRLIEYIGCVPKRIMDTAVKETIKKELNL